MFRGSGKRRPLGQRRHERRRSDRGSVVVLLPAAVLILVALGGIAVDATIEFLGRQQLDDAVAAAARDAVTAGLDTARFNVDGSYTVDQAKAEVIVQRSMSARHDGVVDRALSTGQVIVLVSPTGDPHRPVTVTVRARSTVGLVFSRAIPGLAGSAGVQATATATAVVSP